MSSTESRVALIELEIPIAARRDRVWDALVSDAHAWWREDFYVGSSVKRIVFDARIGGHLYEDWGQGSGVIWGTVIALDRGRSFDLVTHSSLAWGGPRTSMLRVDLLEDGDRTLLKLTDSVHGRIDERGADALREGWRLLLGEGLKPFVESGPQP